MGDVDRQCKFSVPSAMRQNSVLLTPVLTNTSAVTLHTISEPRWEMLLVIQ